MRTTVEPSTVNGCSTLRVVVVEGDPELRKLYEDSLLRLGHQPTLAAGARQALALCRSLPANLLIAPAAWAETDPAAEEVEGLTGVARIEVLEQDDREFAGKVLSSAALAYLVKPIEPDDLVPAIALALRRFAELQALRKEAADLRQAMEDRKIVERAKGIVMRRLGLDEQDAYRRVCKLASDQNRKAVAVAQAIIAAEETFRSVAAVAVPHRD